MRTPAFVLGFLGACVVACATTAPASSPDHPPARSSASAASSASSAAPAPATSAVAPQTPSAVARPSHLLSVPDARRYMLALVNRDRASQGLAPVALDEGPATAAGQAHADDMARLGYLGHWGSDGSVPEERHTEAGGEDMVLENALCFYDEKRRTLDKAPLIDPAQVEKAESQFFDEVPPNDGHRKNILKAWHDKVGIGVAQPIATATETPVPCFSQEFVDDYGSYAKLPAKAKPGETVHVEGTMSNGAKPTGVGVARVAYPKPLPASELNKRRSYPVPKPAQMYWGPGFVTPIRVAIDGARFAIDVPLSGDGQGLYEVSVWGKLAGSDEQTMLGLRTIRVE